MTADTKKTDVNENNAVLILPPVDSVLISGSDICSAVDVRTIDTASFSIDSPNTNMYNIGSTYNS